MTAQARAIASVLGIERSNSDGITPMGFVSRLERGLPVAALERIARLIAPADRSFKYRIVSKATLARRRARRPVRLSPEESERVARLAEIWKAAQDTWGDEAEARAFLFRPHPMLEGRRPIDVVLNSEFGAGLVTDILGRLKYGSAA